MQNVAALYLRLSEEDRNKKSKDDDSLSIENQRLMLVDYAAKMGWSVYHIYSDDDYSGSDRERPAFNQMLTDARARKFNIVLCKTQSRFTRELELVEKYIHGLFPELGIRFVSIVDNIDTAIIGNKKTRQINGLINEWYLEDMSDSIKAALHTRMAAGKHIGSFAPYGYKKDPNNKGTLLVDEEAAEVVRKIFDMYNSGIGRTAIARELNRQGIPNPTGYKIAHGLSYGGIAAKYTKSTLWQYYTVSAVLTNEVYIGTLVQGKYYKPTYKSPHSIPAGKESWVKVEHAHEPIIDMDTWLLTRKLWNSKTKPAYKGNINIFSGKLKCANCGYTLRTTYPGSNRKVGRYFQCPTRNVDKKYCVGVCISQKSIEDAIKTELKKMHNELFNLDDAVRGIDEVDSAVKVIRQTEQELSALQAKQADIHKCMRNLYVDKVKEVITIEQFESFMDDFTTDLNETTSKIQEVQSQLDYLQKASEARKTKQELVETYYNVDIITKPMLDLLIDKIEVGGTRRDRQIIIHWNF